jgi:hypothetical protein
MKLTSAQINLLRQLTNINKTDVEIHYGVRWYHTFIFNGKHRFVIFLNGNVCNALVRKGILVPVEGSLTLHRLNPKGVEHDALDDQRPASS